MALQPLIPLLIHFGRRLCWVENSLPLYFSRHTETKRLIIRESWQSSLVHSPFNRENFAASPAAAAAAAIACYILKILKVLRLMHCTNIGNAQSVMKCNGRLNLITHRQSVCRILCEQTKRKEARTVNRMLYATLINIVCVCVWYEQSK